MLEHLNSLLRRRLDEHANTDAASAIEEQTLAEFTPFKPAEKPPKIDDMSDCAEAAIDELAETLNEWFETDLRVLLDAWQRFEVAEMDAAPLKDVFHAAHNLSGMGETYGQPEIGRICGSLCKLIKSITFRRNFPLAQLHIDACRAIQTTSSSRENANALCAALEAKVSKLKAA